MGTIHYYWAIKVTLHYFIYLTDSSNFDHALGKVFWFMWSVLNTSLRRAELNRILIERGLYPFSFETLAKKLHLYQALLYLSKSLKIN